MAPGATKLNLPTLLSCDIIEPLFITQPSSIETLGPINTLLKI